MTWPELPCYPCPHQARCCHWGVALDDDEALALQRKYGWDKVVRVRGEGDEPDEWRTALTIHPYNGPGGVCVFLNPTTHGCTIWNTPEYPVVCRGFPWRSGTLDEPYYYELEICPEFERRPELVQIARGV